MDITQEMVDQANQDEQAIMSASPEILRAQNNHLNERVVLLRALVNEQQKELEKLRKLRKPQDRRPPAKKAAAKKTTASRKEAK